MADRTVLYRLIADSSQFTAGMASARAQSAQTGVALESTAKKSTAAVSAVEMAGLGLAAALAGKAVMAAANFEEAMSGVQAATHESAATMDTLRDAALEAGATTKFSATEAAAGIENLAKAGVTTSDILNGGLAGALDLAAAGELEVGAAAEIAATALTQFNLAGEDVPHVADLLAAGAGKAQGEVTDLSQALNQAGLVAGQMGLSIEETTGTLSAFASAGLLGSDAGTSLKTMLLRLANPSKEAAQEMERFGISAYDAQGNMLPMADIAGQVQSAFKGQSQATRDAALATIFGSDAIRAANVLYNEGAGGIADWTAKVDDAGYAAETAAIRMDNLKGDLEILMGSFETALIGAGDGSQDSLRGTTQAATGLLDVLNEINSTAAVADATDSMALGGISPDVLTIGLSNLKKTKDAIFGVDDATKDAAESSEEKAAADRAASAATARLAGAAQASAAELKAQAEALADARKAAYDTASGFRSMGESLNDSKRSLGQWLNELQSTREALENFTANARRAAKRGLDDGLIKSLAEAGPEGALRMRELANASEKELGRANREFRGTENAVKDLAKLLLNIPQPKLKVDNGKAISEIDALEARLRAIRDEDVFINVRRIGATTTGPRNEMATGGSVEGPGTGTSDSVPAWLSNGEHVWTAREVDNAGGHDAVERLRSQFRFAGGGGVDKKRKRSGGLDPAGPLETPAQAKARELAEDRAAQAAVDAAEAATRAADAAAFVTEQAADFLSGQEKATQEWLKAAEVQLTAAESLRDSIAAQMEATGKASTAGFQSDLFGDSGGIWGAAGGGPLGALGSDIAGLTVRGDLQAQLSAAGLDGDALAAALSQGTNEDLAALLSSGTVQQFEDMFNERARLTGTVGTAAGEAAYGADFAQANTEVAKYTEVVADFTAQLAAITAQLNPISAAAAQGYAMQGETIAASVSGAIVNGGNTVARRGTGGY